MRDNSWKRRIVWVDDRNANRLVCEILGGIAGKPCKLKRWRGRSYFIAPDEELAIAARIFIAPPNKESLARYTQVSW